MRIGGVEVQGPAEEVLVLPRLDGDIVIRAKAVLDMKPFEAMCALPKAPARLVKGGFEEDTQNKGYMEQLAKHSELRFAYICIRSLEPSEIEWDRVNLNNPDTWGEWSKELTEAGLSSIEVNRIVLCVMQANSLDETKIKEAREVFLRGQGSQRPKSSGPDTAPESTSSGVPASVSE